MAGYSGTPLAKKLGIKPGSRVALVGAPTGLERALGPLPEAAVVRRRIAGSVPLDVIVLFAPQASVLRSRLPVLIKRLQAAGGLWIAWPKKASGVPTDLGDAQVRAAGLAAGLVDNKVCAIDDTWSGLRFVFRLKDRPKAAPAKKHGRRDSAGRGRQGSRKNRVTG